MPPPQRATMPGIAAWHGHENGAHHDVERVELAFDVAADEVLAEPESRVVDEQAHGALVVDEALAHAQGALGLREVGRQDLYLYVGDLPDMFGPPLRVDPHFSPRG